VAESLAIGLAAVDQSGYGRPLVERMRWPSEPEPKYYEAGRPLFLVFRCPIDHMDRCGWWNVLEARIRLARKLIASG
jgi:hypothetical protein